MQITLKEVIVVKKRNITVHNILGPPKGIVVAIEIESREARVEVIGLTMHRPPQEEFLTEIVPGVDLLEVVITELIKYHHQGPNTTGVSTLRFVLHLLPRG